MKTSGGHGQRGSKVDFHCARCGKVLTFFYGNPVGVLTSDLFAEGRGGLACGSSVTFA